MRQDVKSEAARKAVRAFDRFYWRDPSLATLGAMHRLAWKDDPKRLAFTFARYKFVAKMLAGMGDVLEVGCGDSSGSVIVAQHVERLVAIDKDAELLKSAPCHPLFDITLEEHDILQSPVAGRFDAAYALDVLEHIAPEHETDFMTNFVAAIDDHGIGIIGMPSLESQPYASPRSRAHHVNCKTEDDLRGVMKGYFKTVLMFGMNDETLHTGFGPMCHYRLALGVK